MAQFDVYKNINENSKKNIPYLLDIQNDILKDLTSRVVVPLVVNNKGMKILNPEFEIEDKKVIMSTSELASISLDNIGEKVCTLKDNREDIISAIDFLVTGF
ncbi:CcdB family protein [Arcobacter arenosus]|jgi:toxin CcdB|uniref:CcdB family protein n=1 Tax=Arcobacter arenosus TaxID=2576037 RepID=UPI003BA8B42F